jgi:transcriptional regulator with XRE-family HTH domain
MLTDLGKMLRNLCTNDSIIQKKLAKDLGVSPAALSNIVTGKAAPSMELLAGVISRFNLKGKDIKELFFKAFSGSFRSGQKIEIDPRFFKAERQDILAQAIIIMLLCPDDNYLKDDFTMLKLSISSRFRELDGDIKFSPPEIKLIP